MARHYFFLKNKQDVYRFEAKDVDYGKKLSSDYRPHYLSLIKYAFYGTGSSSGEETIGSISFPVDERKSVYYAPLGMKGIETEYLSFGYSWSFEDDTYRFEMDGKEYSSSHDTKKGYYFTVSDIEYVLE